MCFMDTLSNCCGLMDPYGDMPMARGMEASAEIDIMETDGNIHVSVVKTPPRDGKLRLPEVLAAIMGCMPCETECKESVPQKELQDTDEKQDDKMDKPKEQAEGSQPSPPRKPDESTDASGQIDGKDSKRKEFQRS